MAASTDHQQLPSGMNSPTHDQKNKNEDDNENKKKLPNSAGLDSQILCRVVHRSLSVNKMSFSTSYIYIYVCMYMYMYLCVSLDYFSDMKLNPN